MGPNDPFQSDEPGFPHYTTSPPSSPQPPPPTHSAASPAPAISSSLTTALVVGGVAGAGTGVLSLVATWSEILRVGIFMACGVGLAWLIMGIASGQLDPRAAWRALRKQH